MCEGSKLLLSWFDIAPQVIRRIASHVRLALISKSTQAMRGRHVA